MMMTYMVHYTGFPYLAVVKKVNGGSSETGGEERWGTALAEKGRQSCWVGFERVKE